LLSDPRFLTNGDRATNRNQLRPYVTEIVVKYDIETLCRVFDETNIPFSPVRTPSDLFDDPQLNAHGRMLRVKMPDGKEVGLPSLPIAFGAESPGLRLQPPSAGEHTDRILAELGYDPARIAGLRAGRTVR
jgi:crotonobetainyl-CoA:carnitine CoA-transferase CaiB-like acyl-CoA transferase